MSYRQYGLFSLVETKNTPVQLSKTPTSLFLSSRRIKFANNQRGGRLTAANFSQGDRPLGWCSGISYVQFFRQHVRPPATR